MMKAKMHSWSLNDVLNMQTTMPFSYHFNKMLDVKGTTIIHVRASTRDTKHVTLAATVTGSDNMLPTFLILKGAP